MSKLLAFRAPERAPVSDESARELALNIGESFIVEAPAGSGKTGLLVQRFLRLLTDESVQSPDEVLIVTFTRKATAELRERVLAELQAAYDGPPLGAEARPFASRSRELAEAALVRSRQMHWRLLEEPLRLNIQTFDAVCAQIANAVPLLAGGGARRTLEVAQPLYEQAARRTLLQLGGADAALHNALHTVLLHRDGNLRDCERLIAEMLAMREQWGELVPLGPTLDEVTLDTTVRGRLEHALARIVTAGLEQAAAALPAGELAYLAAFASRHAVLPGHNDKPSPVALCAGVPDPPAPIPAEIERWRALIRLVLLESTGQWRKSRAVNTLGFKPAKTELEELKRRTEAMASEPLRAALARVLELPPARYPDEQWEAAKALFRVLRHALVELKLLFAARGECDFAELALAAREVLHADGSASDLALTLGGHLRHLLIDEMQDTSAGQYELVRRLTQSWDGRSQTLFLVGDPKQSIYLFRAASVDRFLRTMDESHMGEIALTPLRLTANFRSQAELVTGDHGFNDAFARIFPPAGAPINDATNDAMDVPYVAATATRAATLKPGVRWHTRVDADSDHAEHEARNIRELVEARLRLPLPADRSTDRDGVPKPWKIAVLGRNRRHLLAVVAEFNRAGLPFKATDLDSLEGRAEVLDALSLTRALLNPADRIAWLAVLRAPWCGLGREDLLALTGDSVDATETLATLIARRGERLSAAGETLLARAWTVLRTAVETLGQTPLAVHVERTWRSLGGDLMLGDEQHRNVMRYLALLHEMESEGGRVDLDALTARLEKLYAEPRAGESQVELLTIHKAKGLQWDMVLVPGLERGSGRNSSRLLNWLDFNPAAAEDEAAMILAPIAGKGSDAGDLNRWLVRQRAARETAELKRLFYVAATRAQEDLHLFAAVKTGKNGLTHGQATSLLSACWPAAEPHFATASGTAEMPAEISNDADDGSAWEYDNLALAAAAAVEPQTLRRLPVGFDPGARFRDAAARRLAYPAATMLPQARSFERPEGSFGVRAFGNVVHRYLQLIADRLLADSPATLAAELPGWRARLLTSLRGEGLPPRDAATESTRALDALTRALHDPVGSWLLSPHPQAVSEGALSLGRAGSAGLRVDRSFLAGPEPGAIGDSCLWIVDFKTTEQGSLSDAQFDAIQRSRYSAQLEAYATIRRQLPGGELPIRLGLYFPLAGRFIHWISTDDSLT